MKTGATRRRAPASDHSSSPATVPGSIMHPRIAGSPGRGARIFDSINRPGPLDLQRRLWQRPSRLIELRYAGATGHEAAHFKVEEGAAAEARLRARECAKPETSSELLLAFDMQPRSENEVPQIALATMLRHVRADQHLNVRHALAEGSHQPQIAQAPAQQRLLQPFVRLLPLLRTREQAPPPPVQRAAHPAIDDAPPQRPAPRRKLQPGQPRIKRVVL